MSHEIQGDTGPSGGGGARSVERVIAEDVKTLHSMGYAQELLRRMGGFSNFAISFSIICIIAGRRSGSCSSCSP